MTLKVNNMSFEVFREPLYRRYYASYTSASFCYAIAFGFLLIFLPLILAYNSVGFWYKEGTYYEQPQVNFRHQAIVEVYGQHTTTGKPFALYYSTSSRLNQQHGDSLRMGVLQSAEQDDNRDGLNDRLEIAFSMPLTSTEMVTGMSAVFLHDVRLQENTKLGFDAASLVEYAAGSPIQQLKVDGDLYVRQTWPAQVRGGFKYPYSSDPLLPLAVSPGLSEMDMSISAIMAKTAARNLSTIFTPTYSLADRYVLMLIDGLID